MVTTFLFMLMEDVMTDQTDANSLYVLIASLLGAVISLPVVWYLVAASSTPGLAA